MEYTQHYNSPLGGITLASDGTSLIGLWFDGQEYFADALEKEHEEKDLPVFVETRRWLDIYFSGRQPDFTPPLRMKTTPFRKMVWEIMLTIPFGETMTYGAIAVRIARQKGLRQMSARAIGSAVGHNSISLIIPCHRVVGSEGKLTGYAGGLDKKVKLLELEKAQPISGRLRRVSAIKNYQLYSMSLARNYDYKNCIYIFCNYDFCFIYLRLIKMRHYGSTVHFRQDCH